MTQTSPQPPERLEHEAATVPDSKERMSSPQRGPGRSSPGTRERAPAARRLREARSPSPQALEGELHRAARCSAERPEAPEARRWLRTNSPERPTRPSNRAAVPEAVLRMVPRQAPSSPNHRAAPKHLTPPKQLSPKAKPNTIAFTCGLRRARPGPAGADPRRADRCNGLLGLPSIGSSRNLDRSTRTFDAARYKNGSTPRLGPVHTESLP